MLHANYEPPVTASNNGILVENYRVFFISTVELTPAVHLPAEWEEHWREEKERRRRAMEDGDEGVAEEDRRQLRRITAYNDARIMGVAARHLQEDEDEEEDGVLAYCCQSHAEDVYAALRGFRECSILTDLTLTPGSGTETLRVHAPVLAAVSSFIRDVLKTGPRAEIIQGSRWSLSLGPEVDLVGLRAVVEFAYSGDVACLEGVTTARVRAAATALGVPRVLEICGEEEEKQGREDEKEEEKKRRCLSKEGEKRKKRAAEWMKASLRGVEELWEEGVGCDVVLDVDGTTFHGRHNFINISHA